MKYFLLCLLFILLNTCFAADEEEFHELQKYQENMGEAIKKIQSMPEKFGLSPTQIEDLQKKMGGMINNEKLINSCKRLWRNPNRATLLYTQLAFFIFMIFFKAWRQSRPAHWFRKILGGFFWSIFTWVCLAIILPIFFLGEDFKNTILLLWNSFKNS